MKWMTFLILLLSVSCKTTNQNSKTKSLVDVVDVSLNADGTFVVTCANGLKATISRQDYEDGNVCLKVAEIRAPEFGSVKILNGKVIVGVQGAFYISEDKGNSWLRKSLPDSDALVRDVIEKAKEYLVATNKGVFVTENAGKNWIVKEQGSNFQALIATQNAIMGFRIIDAVQLNLGYFYRSTDNLESFPGGGNAGNVSVLNSRELLEFKGIAYIHSPYGILESKDEGLTWSEWKSGDFANVSITSLTSANGRLVVLTSPNSGNYAEKVVLVSEDGSTWKKNGVNQGQGDFRKLYWTGSTYFMADRYPRIDILISSDLVSWNRLTLDPETLGFAEKAYYIDLAGQDKDLYVLTTKGLIVSNDGGISWKRK